MISFFRYLNGYLQIRIWGKSPERFLNLCAAKNILLWDICNYHEYYDMYISISGFKKMRDIVRKTKTKVVIQKRIGLPFLMKKILTRKLFLTCLTITFFFWISSTYFIWDISVYGNGKLTMDTFQSFLKQEDVYIGMPKKDLKIKELEKNIREYFDMITWTSVKIDGTNLQIYVRENDNLITMHESGIFDLYAEKDGVVVDMIVRSGVPNVKIGDVITAGELLVSGKIPIYNDDATIHKYQYTYADADIWVERDRMIYDILPYTYVKKIYTGREKTTYTFQIGGKDFDFLKEPSFCYCDCVTESKNMILWKEIGIPVSITTKTYLEYQNTEMEMKLDEAKQILYRQYDLYCEKVKEEGTVILDEKLYMNNGEDVWVLQGMIRVCEKIGIKIPINRE